jgi:hypothetical protein
VKIIAYRIASALLLCVTADSAAGGTLGTKELESLMAQKPNVRAALMSSLTLSESAFAETRLGSHFPHLEGARIGPYTIRATSQDGRNVEIVLCTTYRFLDGKGRAVANAAMETARSIDERLDAVLIQEPQSAERPPKCP